MALRSNGWNPLSLKNFSILSSSMKERKTGSFSSHSPRVGSDSKFVSFFSTSSTDLFFEFREFFPHLCRVGQSHQSPFSPELFHLRVLIWKFIKNFIWNWLQVHGCIGVWWDVWSLRRWINFMDLGSRVFGQLPFLVSSQNWRCILRFIFLHF